MNVFGRERRLLGAAGLVALTAAIGPAAAQGNPEAAGPALENHCATCHQVPGYPEPQRRLGFDAPTFEAIAADAATYTRTRLTMILRQPHYPMTTFLLSTVDIDNVVAFILAMRAP